VTAFPLNEIVKEGYPLKKWLFYRYWLVQCKRLQIGTDMLLTVTSTGDERFKTINIDDHERP